jgi:hypothetical protein
MLKTGFKQVFSIRKPDTKNVREMTVRKPDSPAFGCLLYIENFPFISGL